jgi:hypothetical protein
LEVELTDHLGHVRAVPGRTVIEEPGQRNVVLDIARSTTATAMFAPEVPSTGRVVVRGEVLPHTVRVAVPVRLSHHLGAMTASGDREPSFSDEDASVVAFESGKSKP